MTDRPWAGSDQLRSVKRARLGLIWLLALAVGASLAVSDVLAQDGQVFLRQATGKELLDWCRVARDPGKEAEAQRCADYATSLRRRGDALHLLSFMQGSYYCMPGDIKLGDLVVTLARYLEERPGQLHKNATMLVGRAYAARWPCAATNSLQ
jgi:hypothetical protein